MRHPQAIKNEASELYAQGLSISEISRRLGVPLSTTHKWVSPAGQSYVQRQSEDPKYREYHRSYRQVPENKERDRIRRLTLEAREHRNKLRRQRHAADPTCRTMSRLRCRIYHALRGTVKSASTEELLGISALELTQRFDGEYGLGWKNDRNLHIDHFRPCSSFDLTDPAQQRLCCNWRNLQLLPATENFIKKDRWTPEMESSWAARVRDLGWDGELFLVFGPATLDAVTP